MPFTVGADGSLNEMRDPALDGTASFADYLRAVGSGINNITSSVGQGVEFMDPALGRPLREFGQRGEQYWQDAMTPAGRAIASGDRLSENPFATMGMAAAQSAPGVLAMALPGFGAARGLEMMGMGARAAGALGAGLSEGGYSGLSNAASQTQEGMDVLAHTHAELPEADRYKIALDSAKQVALTTMPWTAATSVLTGGGALGPLLSRLTKTGATDTLEQGLAKTILKGVGAEAGQEFIQSGGEQYLQNIAATSYDPSRSPMDQVLKQAVIGAGAGGLMGGTMGSIHGVLDTAARSLDDIKNQNDAQLKELDAQQAAKVEQDAAAEAEAKRIATFQPEVPSEAKKAQPAVDERPGVLYGTPFGALFGQLPVSDGFVPKAAPVEAPAPTPVQQTPSADLIAQINALMGIGRAPATTLDNVKAAVTEPSGTFANAADTQHEMQLDAGQRMAAQLPAAPETPAPERPKILDVALNRKWGLETTEAAHPLPGRGPKNYVLLEGQDKPLPVGAAEVKAAGYTPEDLKQWYRTPPAEMQAPTQVSPVALTTTPSQEDVGPAGVAPVVEAPAAPPVVASATPSQEGVEPAVVAAPQDATPAAALETPATESAPQALTPQDVHALADQQQVPWDNARAFTNRTKALTGERHLDRLTPEQLQTVHTELSSAPETFLPAKERAARSKAAAVEVSPTEEVAPAQEAAPVETPAPVEETPPAETPKTIKQARVPAAKALAARIDKVLPKTKGKIAKQLQMMKEDLQDAETAKDPDTRKDVHARLLAIEAVHGEDSNVERKASDAEKQALTDGADAIRKMSATQRDNTETPDMPGGHRAFILYEAQRLMPKASGDFKKVTDANSFELGNEADAVVNIEGKPYLATKQEDPDDEELTIWNFKDPADPKDYMGVDTAFSDKADAVADFKQRLKDNVEQAPADEKVSTDPRLISEAAARDVPGIVTVLRAGQINKVLAKLSGYLTPEQQSLANELRALGLKTKVVYTPQVIESSNIKGAVVEGRFMSKTDSIAIFKGGAHVTTILHETVHAATAARLVNALHNGLRIDAGEIKLTDLSPRQQSEVEAASELAKIFIAAEDLAADKGETHYGLTNMKEFVAEAFTNPEFQSFLRNEPKGLWDRFVNFVKQLLGLSASHDMLDDTLRVGRAFFSNDRANTGTMNSEAHVAEWDSLAEKTIAKLPTSMQGPLQKVVDNVTTYAKRGLYMSAFGHDLADIASKMLPSSKDHIRLLDEKGTKKIQLLQKLDSLLAAFDTLPRDAQAQLQTFLKNSTMEQKWGYTPDWKPVTIDTAAEREFNALSPKAQQLAKDIFQYGHNTLTEKVKLSTQHIEEEYAARKAVETDPDKLAQLEAERKNAIRMSGLSLSELEGPYAPLKRLGNWLAVGKSNDYVQAEENRDNALMTKLKADPVHYFLGAYETPAQAKAAQRDLQKVFGTGVRNAETMEKEVWTKDNELPFAAMQRLQSLVASSEDVSSKEMQTMKSLISDIYITALAESSARKSELRRIGVSGADTDMMRSLTVQGQADAHFISSLLYNKEVQDNLTAMSNEARDGTEGDRLTRSQIYNEFLKRHVASLNYYPTPVQDTISRFTYNWMLMASPSYLLQNLSQPFMMTAPLLEARFGALKGMGTLMSIYKELKPILNGVQAVEPSRFINKIGRETEMLKALQDNGRIDTNLINDVGSWAHVSKTTAGQYYGSTMRKFSNVMSVAESVNRITSAVAAYRLDYEQQLPKLGKEGAHAHATAYADSIIQQTHGNYDSSNAPRWMMPGAKMIPGVKLLTQFRKFQIIQLSLMARLLHNAFLHSDAEEKMVARKALGWIFAHHMTVTGAMGAPFFGLIAPLLGLALGDAGEPDDPELVLRRLIGDKETADLLLHGVPGALGLSLTNKIGMGQITSIMPFTNVDLSNKAGLGETALGLSGPFVGGLLPRAVDGVNMIRQGDYYKGVETLMPQAVANAMKSYRYATEGVTMRNGDRVLAPDEINLATTTLQALGFPSNQITDRQFRQSVLIEFENAFKAKAGDITHEYNAAAKDGDGARKAELEQDWRDLQEAKVRNGFTRQPVSVLRKAPQGQAKRERSSVDGVEFKKQNKDFVQENAGI